MGGVRRRATALRRFARPALAVVAALLLACALTLGRGDAAIAETATLTVTLDGAGSVTSSPAGIDCGTTCSAGFDLGTEVTLTPTPAATTAFTGWSGDCTGTGPCKVTVDAAKSVTAKFESRQLAVTVTGAGTVTSAPAGIDCGSTCSAPFPVGGKVTLTAAAAAGHVFTGWSGACSGTGNTCDVTLDADKAVTATFVVTHRLTVVRTGTGSGKVTGTPGPIDCGATCTADLAEGTVVTLTATADSGSDFGGWGGDCSGSDTCKVTLDADRSVAATFTKSTAATNVTVVKAGQGAGTVTSAPAGIDCGTTCSGSFPANAAVTLTATPAAGSTFVGWSNGCSGNGTCTVPAGETRTVVAEFAVASYTLVVVPSGNGKGTVTSSPAGISCGVSCSFPFAAGTVVTLTAAPAADTSFGGWSGACSGTQTTCTVTMDDMKAVGALFGSAETNLTVDRQGGGTGRVTSSPAGIDCGTLCTASFSSGTSVTLTAAAATGSVFTGWGGACSGALATCTVSISGAKTVTATFVPALTVVVSRTGTGTGTVVSSPAGVSCGSACSGVFASTQQVTLTATPALGSTFDGWGGSCTGTATTCILSGSGTRSATATFTTSTTTTTTATTVGTATAYTVKVARTGTGSGTVTSAPKGIACGKACSVEFPAGTAKVTLVAKPAAGSSFVGWSGACTGTTRTCVLVSGTDSVVRATFRRSQLAARVLSAKPSVVRKAGKVVGKRVVARLFVNVPATAIVTLQRQKPPAKKAQTAKKTKTRKTKAKQSATVLATQRVRVVKPGSFTLRLVAPPSTTPGAAFVKLVATDATRKTVSAVRTVRLG